MHDGYMVIKLWLHDGCTTTSGNTTTPGNTTPSPHHIITTTHHHTPQIHAITPSHYRTSTPPHHHSTTIPQHHNTTTLQHHNTTIPQHHNTITPSHHHSITPSRHHIITISQQHHTGITTHIGIIVASDAQPPTSAAEAGPSAAIRETRANVTNEGETLANIEMLCTCTSMMIHALLLILPPNTLFGGTHQ